ncbi:MAG TPA: helix-turn-helix transcriptional regulator, partial [Lachnospiraceae bacterium]|nr:helix-turn-helix transcriptional regulator [Lachnospiraceae bacterium]
MLAEIRKQRGLSQGQLSLLSGESIRMIQYYEQGKKDINKAQG